MHLWRILTYMTIHTAKLLYNIKARPDVKRQVLYGWETEYTCNSILQKAFQMNQQCINTNHNWSCQICLPVNTTTYYMCTRDKYIMVYNYVYVCKPKNEVLIIAIEWKQST